jgi:glycyl-tRNA synthetase
MLSLYDVNALVHWTEREIDIRDSMMRFFAAEMRRFLLSENKAWQFERCEAPLLIPRDLISDAYTNDDIWVQERLSASDHSLVLRPETTPSTYIFMQHLLASHSGVRPPLCVWQAGKSFRREQEQPTKHMRLKEFHQQEFQCLYTRDTFNDYHTKSLEVVRQMIATMMGRLPTRIVPSDRLPAYSEATFDVEVDNGDKWMEVCSISKRKDFGPVKVPTKKGFDEKDTYVLEVAIGLDRCVYNWNIANGY